MATMIKIGISEDAKSFVEQTASRLHTSEADVVRKALEAYRFLQNVAEEDGAIVIQRKDGKHERLVRF
jgi:hypothetical protein